jgi:hypothetical protein
MQKDDAILVECKECGEEFRTTLTLQVFCGPACRCTWNNRRYRELRKAAREEERAQ